MLSNLRASRLRGEMGDACKNRQEEEIGQVVLGQSRGLQERWKERIGPRRMVVKSEESRQKRDEDTNFSVEDLVLGLKDVLAQLDREQARVKLRLEMRRFSKPTTIIEGLKMSRRELQNLSSAMKRRLATGGTVKDGVLLFQAIIGKEPPSYS